MMTDERRGVFTIGGETFTLAGSVSTYTKLDGRVSFEADVTEEGGDERHLVLVGDEAVDALRQLGAM